MVWVIAFGIGIAAALALLTMFRISERKTREIELRLKAKRAEAELAKLNAEKEWLDKIREHNRLVARDIARARNQEVADRIAANRKPQAPKPQPSRVVPTYTPAKTTAHRSSYGSPSSSSDDSFSVGLGIATGLSLFDSPSIDTSSTSTPDDFSGGGGDFGGGGASGDW